MEVHARLQSRPVLRMGPHRHSVDNRRPCLGVRRRSPIRTAGTESNCAANALMPLLLLNYIRLLPCKLRAVGLPGCPTRVLRAPARGVPRIFPTHNLLLAANHSIEFQRGCSFDSSRCTPSCPPVHCRNSDGRSRKRAMLPSCSPLSSLRAN